MNIAGGNDAPLLVLEEYIRNENPHAPNFRTNFSKVDPKELLNIPAFSLERVLEKELDFLQSDGTDLVHDDTISSVSFKFPGLELNVHKLTAWMGGDAFDGECFYPPGEQRNVCFEVPLKHELESLVRA